MDANRIQNQFLALSASLTSGNKPVDGIVDVLLGRSASSGSASGGSRALRDSQPDSASFEEAAKPVNTQIETTPKPKRMRRGKTNDPERLDGNVEIASNPKGGSGGSGKNGSRGRPKKDWTAEMKKELELFAESTEGSVVYWGSEARTKVKDLQKEEADMKTRKTNSRELTEVEEMQLLLKQVSIIIALIRCAAEHGLSSEQFAKCYDHQTALMALPPVVKIDFPGHIRWARHARGISGTELVERWLARVDSAELRRNGVKDVSAEQERQWAERFAGVLRVSDGKQRTAQLHELFQIEMTVELEPTVSDFVFALASILHISQLDGLEQNCLHSR